MQFFQFALTFACLSMASLAQVPQVPHADVHLTGGPQGGSIKAGNNFVLTCNFNSTYPKDSDSSSSTNEWVTVVSFWHNNELVGEYSNINSYYFGFVTKSLKKGVNFYPVEKTENAGMQEAQKTNYSVVVMPTETTVASGYYLCSATLQAQRDDSTNKNAVKNRFFSNQLSFN